ncbi:signal peptidase I [Candidatus Saccharibacteria bacterium]|nr:signal peptidase I [Candidatus Saccharibacteria bacterium]
MFLYSFTSSIKSYYLAAVLGVLLVVAIAQFGLHRDKHYLKNYVSRIVVACLMVTFIVSFGLGLFLNFTHSSFSLNPHVILSGFLPALLISCEAEVFQYVIFHSYFRNLRPVAIYVVAIAAANILISTNFSSFASPEAVFITICTIILPVLATESLCGYLRYKIGLRPALIYKLSVRLYPFVLPILPNLGPFIYAVMAISLPAAIFLFTYNLHVANRKDQKRIRRRNQMIITTSIVFVLLAVVILVSGIFKYQIIAIASNSMNPTFARGDAVVLEKTSADKIVENDILVFKHEGIIITHRVTQIYTENDRLYFVTKGDNNEEVDAFRTDESQVVGRVVIINKFIGYPTVWLSELFKTE